MSVKGLRKIIYPFAPDQSGAVSVLYELGGMVIICDAGGCAGNVCGFDEPRWLGTTSAVFSAGLRDMDAILGRDDLMIEKIVKAASKIDAKFVAIVGTPVPATIATDYKALRRMGEKRIGLPVITLDTNGAKLYDEGEAKAYLELFKRFAKDPAERESLEIRETGTETAAAPGTSESGQENGAAAAAVGVISGSAGVIGVTPLDTEGLDAPDRIRAVLAGRGISHAVCYGSGSSFEDLADAGRMERNIVVSTAGLKAARYLKDRFGTPYEIYDPLAEEEMTRIIADHASEIDRSSRILIIHQQVRANTLRSLIRKRTDACITAATWFMMDDEISEPGDIKIREEEDFFDLVENGGFDVIIADRSFRKAARKFRGTYIDMQHFAVSGESTGMKAADQ